MTRTRQTSTGLFWAATAIAIWSGSLVLLRFGVTTSLNAYDLTALRFGVAALILLPVILRHGFGLATLRPGGLVLVVAGLGAPYVLMISWAMVSAPAGAAGALNPGVMAIAAILLGGIVQGERIGRLPRIGILLILGGILVFTGGHIGGGHLLLVMSGIMWAGYTLVIRRACIPALQAAAIVAVGSALAYLPVYLAFLPKAVTVAPLPDVLMQAGFQGFAVSVIAIFAFNRSTELLGPVTGASLPALIPLATLGIGVVLLGEPAGGQETLGAGTIGLGVVLILAGRSFRISQPMGWLLRAGFALTLIRGRLW